MWESKVHNDDLDLWFLHHLSKEQVYPTQDTKIIEASVVQLFLIQTAVRLCELPADPLTTAWFVREAND